MSAWDEWLPTVFGFVWTTIVGGFFGLWLQNRAWRHQHAVQVAEQDRDRAMLAFEEISRLLDRRLFRTKQVFWWLEDDPMDPKIADTRAEAMRQYREVMFAFNESSNRNAALVERFFGAAIRQDYEDVNRDLVRIGGHVTDVWRDAQASMRVTTEAERAYMTEIAKVATQIYDFNVRMLRAVQEGAVGAKAPR